MYILKLYVTQSINFFKKIIYTIDIGKVTEKIIKPAYQNNGILYTIEYEKNEQNQEEGHKISFVSAKKATNDIKKWSCWYV